MAKRKKKPTPSHLGENLGHVAIDEFDRRVQTSRGYAAGYAGQRRDKSQCVEWLEGYDRARATMAGFVPSTIVKADAAAGSTIVGNDVAPVGSSRPLAFWS